MTSFGCIGITKSAGMFLNSPSVGTTEIEMVMTYGQSPREPPNSSLSRR